MEELRQLMVEGKPQTGPEPGATPMMATAIAAAVPNRVCLLNTILKDTLARPGHGVAHTIHCTGGCRAMPKLCVAAVQGKGRKWAIASTCESARSDKRRAASSCVRLGQMMALRHDSAVW